MNTMETLTSRKSVRSYTGERLSSEELALLLKAANASPVGMGQYENVHLTVIQNPELLRKIDAAGAALFGKPDMHPLYGAPTLIMISAKAPAPGGENVAYSNTAIIAHNITLEAVELGLGSCLIWGATLAAANDRAIISELGLPEGFVPNCAVALGKTDEKYEIRDIPTNRIASETLA